MWIVGTTGGRLVFAEFSTTEDPTTLSPLILITDQSKAELPSGGTICVQLPSFVFPKKTRS